MVVVVSIASCTRFLYLLYTILIFWHKVGVDIKKIIKQPVSWKSSISLYLIFIVQTSQFSQIIVRIEFKLKETKKQKCIN